MSVITVAEGLKVGDVFYEEGYGHTITMKVKSPPVTKGRVISWTAITERGTIAEYLINKDYLHYAPTIYR